MEQVKELHPCYIYIRRPTFKHCLVPTYKNLLSDCLEYAIKSDILEHNCLVEHNIPCTLDVLRKNTLISCSLLPFLFVKNGNLLYKMSVAFEYACIIYHKHIDFSNVLSESR